MITGDSKRIRGRRQQRPDEALAPAIRSKPFAKSYGAFHYYPAGNIIYIGLGGSIGAWSVSGHRLNLEKTIPLQPDEWPEFISAFKGKLIYGSGLGIGLIDKNHGGIQEVSRSVIKSCYGFADSAGNVWIGTSGQGWYRYNGHGLITMPVDRREYLLDAHAVIPDQQGFLWVSTNYGLFRYGHKDAGVYEHGRAL